MELTFQQISQIIPWAFSTTAIIVSISVYRKNRAVNVYSNLDAMYMDLLKLSIENPSFIDPSRTKDYQSGFKDDDLRRYGQYANIAWNICETIVDRKDDKKNFETWKPVLLFESQLHKSWFEDESNQIKFKQRFRNYVRDSILID
jgi:hypothetical protein